jgi:DUF1009 family protein
VPPRLGIVAGGGALPRQVVDAARAGGREVFVLALNGETDPRTTEGVPHAWHDGPDVSGIVATLRAAGCEEIVTAGPVGRPDFRALAPRDLMGARLLPRLIRAAMRGDDAIFRTIVSFFEEQGFRVIGADSLLDQAVVGAGPLGAHRPSAVDDADIAKGAAVVRELGRLDIGQAAVVRDGHVLAVEAAEGTDAMLERCAQFRRGTPGGVLVKLTKPGQQRQIDLPTIGPETVRGAGAANLCGIAVESGATLLVDRARLIAAADAAGLFVVGIAP